MKRFRTVVGAALIVLVTSCAGDPAAETQPTTPTPSSVAIGDTPSDNSDMPDGTARDSGLAVWWDKEGLHHGETVEKTAVPLEDAFTSRLALVRSGALYRVEQTDDIWFHPWGGTPRVVGHGTAAGAAGDPEGDTAAWFDGRDLVVYDTARDEVVSRTPESARVLPRPEYVEHVGHGNGWVYVSSTQVVWRSAQGLARKDLVSGTTELPWRPRPFTPPSGQFVDVSRDSAVWLTGDGYEGRGTYVVERAGSTKILKIPALEIPGRLSPDGSRLLAPEIADGTHGVAVIDLRSGLTWKPFEKATYAVFSWSYGDVVVMRTSEDVRAGRWTLTSCSASERSCERLDASVDVVLPNP